MNLRKTFDLDMGRANADIARAAQREYARHYRETHREQIRISQQKYWYRKGLKMQAEEAARSTQADGVQA